MGPARKNTSCRRACWALTALRPAVGYRLLSKANPASAVGQGVIERHIDLAQHKAYLSQSPGLQHLHVRVVV